MGRTKGTLICSKCRRTNPPTEDRVRYGCRHCGCMFSQDKNSKVMLDMDNAIKKDKKLEKQMDNSFLYPNEP